MCFTPNIQLLLDQSIVLFRQAIADARTGEISHYEILSRFKEDGLLRSPVDLVEWLERHGLIGYLDRHVIALTLAHLARTRDASHYAINLSADTINQNGKFSKFLATQRALYGLDEIPLIIEITERVSLANTAIAQSVLAFVRAIGCPLAVDDFGAPGGAFSTLSLDMLRPAYLKIDGSYTRRLPDTRAIADINAYCAIAHAREIRVILEQVEENTLEIVREQTNVDLIQGFAVGVPEILQ